MSTFNVVGRDTLRLVMSDGRVRISEGKRFKFISGGPRGPQGIPGQRGLKGDTGPSNLFIQQANPAMADPGMWWELNPDGSLKTLWVETGA